MGQLASVIDIVYEADAVVLDACKTYFSWRIYGSIPFLGLLTLHGWFSGRNKPKVTFCLVALLGSLEIVLSYIFIIKFDLGARGAGIAIISAEWVVFVVGLLCAKHSCNNLIGSNFPRLSKALGFDGMKSFLRFGGILFLRYGGGFGDGTNLYFFFLGTRSETQFSQGM